MEERQGLRSVEGDPTEDDLEALRRGVTLKDGPSRPTEVERIRPPDLSPRHPPVRFRKNVPDSQLLLTLREGRNRQIRRMTAAVGRPTLRLVRWRIGPWTLDGLGPGGWRSFPARSARTELTRTATIELSSDPADKTVS